MRSTPTHIKQQTINHKYRLIHTVASPPEHGTPDLLCVGTPPVEKGQHVLDSAGLLLIMPHNWNAESRFDSNGVRILGVVSGQESLGDRMRGCQTKNKHGVASKFCIVRPQHDYPE